MAVDESAVGWPFGSSFDDLYAQHANNVRCKTIVQYCIYSGD